VSSQSERLDLSIVVPVFNEEENVAILHQQIAEALQDTSLSYEVIFVDDGSVDRTVERLREICSRDHRVTALRFRRNYGQTAAVQAGFDFSQGAAVVTMDGDLQNDPVDIPRLLQALDEGFDVISGWRKERQDRAVTRRLPSKVANWMIGSMTGVHVHDNGCMMKAYRGDLVRKARLYAEMHRFLVPMLTLSGCRIKEMVVNHRARQFGESKYGLSRIWKVLLDLLTVKMLLRFSSHPATWFAILGVPFGFLGIVSGIGSILLYVTKSDLEAFPVILPAITVLSFFLAAHLLLLGMFAELTVTLGDSREADLVGVELVLVD